MSLEPTIVRYLTESDLPPTLSVTYENFGWIEYLNQTGSVYYFPKMPLNVYQYWAKFHSNTLAENSLQSTNDNNIGLVQHLAYELLERPFLLPIFANVRDNGQTEITCGHSRFSAYIANGTPSDHVPMVLYSQSPVTDTTAIKINSTTEFEKIFELANLNYHIDILYKTVQPEVSASVLRHSIYDVGNAVTPHKLLKLRCIEFWNTFVKDNKIKITISCVPEVRRFVQDSPLFDVTFLDQTPEWGWSYGRLLAEFKSTKELSNPDALNLWLFDVTQPVNLHLVLPWASGEFSAYHTKNKKAALFNPRFSSGIKIIGDCIQ